MPVNLKDTLPCSCEKRHKWDQKLNLPMDLKRFAKGIAKIRCPKCGSADVTIDFGGVSPNAVSSGNS